MDAFRYKNPIVDVSELVIWTEKEPVSLFDCRFYLADPQQGMREYAESHIPSAKYLHLDDDLSSPIGDGSKGRHPLPDSNQLWALLRGLGVNQDSVVVAYDSSGGPYASRLWWLLRQRGFQNVWVLDGGWGAWLAYQNTHSKLVRTAFDALELRMRTQPKPKSVLGRVDVRIPALVEAGMIETQRDQFMLIDSRTRDRYLGQNETIDPVAGHIPGAANLSWLDNLDSRGQFRSRETLEKRFKPFFDAGKKPVFYCGSGVTACHNILASQIAGLPMPALYADSWSGWISDPTRPVQLGDE